MSDMMNSAQQMNQASADQQETATATDEMHPNIPVAQGLIWIVSVLVIVYAVLKLASIVFHLSELDIEILSLLLAIAGGFVGWLNWRNLKGSIYHLCTNHIILIAYAGSALVAGGTTAHTVGQLPPPVPPIVVPMPTSAVLPTVTPISPTGTPIPTEEPPTQTPTPITPATPTLSPTPKHLSQCYVTVIAANGVNIRAYPGYRYETIFAESYGTILKATYVTTNTTIESDEPRQWYGIESDGTIKGWVIETWLDTESCAGLQEMSYDIAIPEPTLTPIPIVIPSSTDTPVLPTETPEPTATEPPILTPTETPTPTTEVTEDPTPTGEATEDPTPTLPSLLSLELAKVPGKPYVYQAIGYHHLNDVREEITSNLDVTFSLHLADRTDEQPIFVTMERKHLYCSFRGDAECFNVPYQILVELVSGERYVLIANAIWRHNGEHHSAEAQVQFVVFDAVPTPTEPPTWTPSHTPTETPTPTRTLTPFVPSHTPTTPQLGDDAPVETQNSPAYQATEAVEATDQVTEAAEATDEPTAASNSTPTGTPTLTQTATATPTVSATPTEQPDHDEEDVDDDDGQDIDEVDRSENDHDQNEHRDVD